MSSPNSVPPSAARGLLQIALGGVLWGTGGLAVQLIRRHATVSVFTISAYRTLIGAVILVATVLAHRQWRVMSATVRAQPGAVAVAGVGTALYQVLYFVAVVDVGVSVATVISLGLAPVILTISGSVVSRSRPSLDHVQVLGLAVTGLILISFFGVNHTAGPHPILGAVAALGSGSIYAATVAVAGPLTERNPPLLITTAATVVGAVVIVPIVAIKSSGAGMGVGHGPSTLIGLAYLGAFTMALAYGLFYAGLRTTPQRSAVIATLLEPVTVVIASALILGERLDLGAAIGAAMILGSVVLLWLRNQKTRPIPIRA